jgi:hypothetical protein
MFAIGDKVLYHFCEVMFPCKITRIDIIRDEPRKQKDGMYSLREYVLKCKVSASLPTGEIVTDDITHFYASI